MHVWLITVGEPLPVDGSYCRLLRTGNLAEMLVSGGHQVTWWSSTFDHMKKFHRFDVDTKIRLEQKFSLILLHARGYKRNVSLSRLIDHHGVARSFLDLSTREQQPDIILCSLPTLELSLAATDYGRKRGIPVILDIRDLWPDALADLLPAGMRGLARFLLFPIHYQARKACTRATALVGTAPGFIDWGLRHAGRSPLPMDRCFPLGFTEKPVGQKELASAKNYWRKLGLKQDNYIVCFMGTIGRQFDLETVIDAASLLKEGGHEIKFVLCGTGDKLKHFQKLAAGCENIVFPGWVNRAEIRSLMEMSSIGLAPYKNTTNFMENLPNKPIEYLSAGLPLVSCLNGYLKKMLKENECGETYPEGNAPALADGLVRIKQNPELAQKMSVNGYRLFREKFVMEKIYGDMIEHLKTIALKTHSPEESRCPLTI